MGGCTNCTGKAGCDDRKGTMVESVDQALEELYPTKTWGVVDDTQANGTPREELDALADELAQELGAATFVREGGDDEPCDYIYVLCLGRTPCVVQVRDHGVAVPDEWSSIEAPISELYLRVVSASGRASPQSSRSRSTSCGATIAFSSARRRVPASTMRRSCIACRRSWRSCRPTSCSASTSGISRTHLRAFMRAPGGTCSPVSRRSRTTCSIRSRTR